MFNREENSPKYPCYQCRNRHPGCQDVCLELLAAQLVYNQNKRKTQQAKARTHDVDSFKISMVNQLRRKKSRQI